MQLYVIGRPNLVGFNFVFSFSVKLISVSKTILQHLKYIL